MKTFIGIKLLENCHHNYRAQGKGLARCDCVSGHPECAAASHAWYGASAWCNLNVCSRDETPRKLGEHAGSYLRWYSNPTAPPSHPRPPLALISPPVQITFQTHENSPRASANSFRGCDSLNSAMRSWIHLAVETEASPCADVGPHFSIG